MVLLKLTDRLAIAALSAAALLAPAALFAPTARAETVNSGAMSGTPYVAKREATFSADRFESIRAGMSTSDVVALIGQPYNKMRFPLTRTTAWDYRGRDAWNYDTDFSVIVGDNGIVVGRVAVRNGQ